MAKDAPDLRDGLAEDRTVLANERTYAAWARTGLTALAAWVAVEKLMVDIVPDWSIRAIAVSLLAFATATFVIGFWRYHRTSSRLRSGFISTFPSLLVGALTALLLIAAMAAMAARVLS